MANETEQPYEGYTWSRVGAVYEPEIRPYLPAEEWTQVDLAVAKAINDIAELTGLETVLVLTPDAAEENASGVYIYLEPCAHVVIALSHSEKKASISANYELWESANLEREFRALINHAEQVLQRETLMRVIISVVQQATDLLCARGSWTHIPSY